MKKYKIYIGIDCGVSTGYCEWNASMRGIQKLETLPIHKAMLWVKEMSFDYDGQIFVRVEDARLRTWIPYGKNEKAERGRREGAGSVKRDAKIWDDFLKDLGIPYEMVPPKKNKTKVKSDYFKTLTGYRPQTNEHERDAAMLVFGY